MLADGTCCFQSFPYCGQCRRSVAMARQGLGLEGQAIRQQAGASEPGPVRYAPANAGDCFVVGTFPAKATPRNMPGSSLDILVFA
jgi:hypothetical protein